MEIISDKEFQEFAQWLYKRTGIHLNSSKKVMLTTRLRRRLMHYQLNNYGDYYRLVSSGAYPEEAQVMIDHLTTNETHFFREPKHFKFLADTLRSSYRKRTEPCRVWCAASSSGEEVYTLAMVLDDVMGKGRWSVLGSDISSRVLQKARRGIYPEEQNVDIPEHYLKQYCLKGVGEQEGNFAFDRSLRQSIELRQVNLTESLVSLGQFDFVFIRNVMIYFDGRTKADVVKRVVAQLKPGGYIVTSHSESLHGLSNDLTMVSPSVYRRST